MGKWGEIFPAEAYRWKGDYLISYLSCWKISEQLIKKARIAAINFHAAPPEYRGIGCNFALYHLAKEYGVTCHHIDQRFDSGKIVAVERFPILSSDKVETLLARTYDRQLNMFFGIMNLIAEGKKLPESKEKWSKKLYTRKDVNSLRRISCDMSKKEISKRIRATDYSNWKPFINLNGFIFEYAGWASSC